jgi:excisionase family DNA binding protein
MSKVHNASITVTAQAANTPSIKRLEKLLSGDTAYPKLVGADGKEISLPEPVYKVLQSVVQAMAAGQAISIVPANRELTTQEAADLLNVSRPYLIKLLKQGDIPHIMVGSHRRVNSQDLMDYKNNRDAERRQNIHQLTNFLQEEGFYD